MTTNNNFTPVEHFKSVAIQTYNKLVREEFKDIEEDLSNSITTPRSSLKTACLINPNDSQILINNKMMMFYFVLRKASDLQPPLAAIDYESIQQKVVFKPQITLFFKEKQSEVETGFFPIKSQISLRLIDETHLTITNSKLKSIATKIKSDFGGNTPFKFRRGKISISYKDKNNGYRFWLLAYSKDEAKNLLSNILGLVNKTPQWEYLNVSETDNSSEAYPILPPQKNILGELRRLPRKRPVGNVYFSHATAEIYGVPKPIFLYGGANSFRKALIY